MEEEVNTSMVFEQGAMERLRLFRIANILNKISGELNSESFYVDDIWWDYGAKMMWTTIIATRKGLNMEYQILYPNTREAILKMDDEEIKQWARVNFNDDRAYEGDF